MLNPTKIQKQNYYFCDLVGFFFQFPNFTIPNSSKTNQTRGRIFNAIVRQNC